MSSLSQRSASQLVLHQVAPRVAERLQEEAWEAADSEAGAWAAELEEPELAELEWPEDDLTI